MCFNIVSLWIGIYLHTCISEWPQIPVYTKACTGYREADKRMAKTTNRDQSPNKEIGANSEKSMGSKAEQTDDGKGQHIKHHHRDMRGRRPLLCVVRGRRRPPLIMCWPMPASVISAFGLHLFCQLLPRCILGVVAPVCVSGQQGPKKQTCVGFPA